MRFVKGKSGNPGGRKPLSPDEKAARDLLKAKSFELMEKAIKVATADKHDSKVLVALINKICPELVSFEGDNPLLILIQKAINAPNKD